MEVKSARRARTGVAPQSVPDPRGGLAPGGEAVEQGDAVTELAREVEARVGSLQVVEALPEPSEAQAVLRDPRLVGPVMDEGGAAGDTEQRPQGPEGDVELAFQ